MSKASGDESIRKSLFSSRSTPRAIGPLVVAGLATLVSLSTLARGPGVTCDEIYHVGSGKRLVAAFRHQGPAFFSLANVRRNFPWKPGGPPVQPPLGHFILGCSHHVFDTDPDNPWVISVVAPRFAPAVAFGVLVLLVGLATMRMEGPAAGTVAAAAVVLVPRVFGHSHIAALDTLSTFFFVAAILAVVEADARGGRARYFALAGVVWGLAMLAKLHGVLVLRR